MILQQGWSEGRGEGEGEKQPLVLMETGEERELKKTKNMKLTAP